MKQDLSLTVVLFLVLVIGNLLDIHYFIVYTANLDVFGFPCEQNFHLMLQIIFDLNQKQIKDKSFGKTSKHFRINKNFIGHVSSNWTSLGGDFEKDNF